MKYISSKSKHSIIKECGGRTIFERIVSAELIRNIEIERSTKRITHYVESRESYRIFKLVSAAL